MKTFENGDKVKTLVNGFSGDVRVCTLSDVSNGYAFANYTDEGRKSRVYVRLADCEPVTGNAEVGDTTTMDKSTDVIIAEGHKENGGLTLTEVRHIRRIILS